MKSSITVAFVLALTCLSSSFAAAATSICKRNLQNNVRLQPNASTNFYAQMIKGSSPNRVEKTLIKQGPTGAGSAVNRVVSRNR